MARNFNSNNRTKSLKRRAVNRLLWQGSLYSENGGLGPDMIKDINFAERIHYGFIDSNNNSIIPDEKYIVNTTSGRVFDFVADSYSLMRLNWTTAVQKSLVSVEGTAFSNLDMVDSYKNPRVKYGEYLGRILRYYNETHIPNIIGIYNITSYEDYVKNFLDYLINNFIDFPISMTRWNTSINSRQLDTGLSFSYSDMPFDEDQRKINEIIDHPSYGYFKNLCMNMGFSIAHNTPNVLVYDIDSPAGASIRNSYGLFTLPILFNKRYIKTYTIDNNLLYNNINIYYNKYAIRNSPIKVVKTVWNGTCNKTVTDKFIELEPVSNTNRPYNDLQEINIYCRIRSAEEGHPFSQQKINNILKKSKYLLKTLDKSEAMRYINDEFRDQVWNKNYGFHDLKLKLEGKTTTQAQRGQIGAVPSRRGSSSSY